MSDNDGPTLAEEWGHEVSPPAVPATVGASWCFLSDEEGAEAETEAERRREDAAKCYDIRDMCGKRRRQQARPAAAAAKKTTKRAKLSLHGVSAGEGEYSPLLRPPNRAVCDIPPPEPRTRGRKLIDWLARTPGSRVVFVEEMPAGVPTRICMLRHEHSWLPEQLDYLLQYSGARVECMDACGAPERAFCCLWRNYLDNLTTVDVATMLPSVDFDEADDGPAVHVYLRFR